MHSASAIKKTLFLGFLLFRITLDVFLSLMKGHMKDFPNRGDYLEFSVILIISSAFIYLLLMRTFI